MYQSFPCNSSWLGVKLKSCVESSIYSWSSLFLNKTLVKEDGGLSCILSCRCKYWVEAVRVYLPSLELLGMIWKCINGRNTFHWGSSTAAFLSTYCNICQGLDSAGCCLSIFSLIVLCSATNAMFLKISCSL